MRKRGQLISFILAAMFLGLFTTGGCGPVAAVVSEREAEQEQYADEMPSLSPVPLSEGEKLQVVATTSIVADIAGNIGGDLINLTMLMPLGTDPHTFEPTPQDAAAVTDAHVVFINGAGLEIFLENLLESAGGSTTIVPVSYGVELLHLESSDEQEREEESGHRGSADPHTWFDPHNVTVWTRNIEWALSALDPKNAEAYTANARAYEAKLQELDTWIREQVSQIPQADRKLVTDHTTFGYFCRRYGFEQVGAVFPGYSTLTEPSAQDVAQLEDAIRELNVKAVFVGKTVNPNLAEQITEDTGIQLISLYTGSLSEPGGPAGDYLSLMRYDVSAIVEALR